VNTNHTGKFTTYPSHNPVTQCWSQWNHTIHWRRTTLY